MEKPCQDIRAHSRLTLEQDRNIGNCAFYQQFGGRFSNHIGRIDPGNPLYRAAGKQEASRAAGTTNTDERDLQEHTQVYSIQTWQVAIAG